MKTFKIKSFVTVIETFVDDKTIETVLTLSDSTVKNDRSERYCFVDLSSFRARGNDYGKNFEIKRIYSPFELTVDDIQDILRISSVFNQKLQETIFTSI